MNLFSSLLRRPVRIVMVYGLVCCLGLLSYFFLPVELLPNVSFRHITIYLPVRGGMLPDQVEKLVTRPVEEAMSSVANLARLESISKSGLATVVLSFSADTNMDLAALEVREKFMRVEGKLPREKDKPVIAKYLQSDIPVMILALVSETAPVEKLREWVDQEVKERLLQIPGVANVEVSGGRERKILVEARLDRLNAFGLRLDDVVEAIGSNNADFAVGEWAQGDKKFLVRSLGAVKGIEELENLIVEKPDTNTVVRLKDVASVRDDFLEPQSLSRMNRESVVTLYLQKESEANTPEVCRRLRGEIARLEKEKGKEAAFYVISDQSIFIEQALGQVRTSLLSGAVLTAVVLYFFFRRWRPTLILLVPFPVSLLAAFAALYVCGISLNVMSLSGLALGIGMLVDSAILVFENIQKKWVESGSGDIYRAAENGTREVMLALAASTATTLIVFIPLVYLNSEMRLAYGGLALAVAFSLLASLAAAVTLIPCLTPRICPEPVVEKHRWLRFAEARYPQWLDWLLTPARRRRVLAAIGGALALAALAAAGMPKQFFGEPDQGKFTVFVEMPAGTKLEVSDQVVHQLENYLAGIKEVETVSSRIEGWSSKLFVGLAPEGRRRLTTMQAIERLRPGVQRIAEAGGAFSYFSEVQAGENRELSFEIYGHDLAALKRLAAETGRLLTEVRGVGDIKLRYKEGRPEQLLSVDRNKVALVGWTPQQLADAVHAHVRGVEATRFHTQAREVDTIVRLAEPDRATVGKIKELSLVTPREGTVALAELVDFKESAAASEIWRKGKERMIAVSGTSFKLSAQKGYEAMQRKLARLELPKGYSVRISDEFFEQKKRAGELRGAFLITLLLLYMLLASILESYRQPLLVMASIPLAAIGSVLLLYLAGKPLTLGVLIGGILLAGIVVNHSIVLLDTFNRRRRDGLDFTAALTQTGRDRLSPILLSTATTVAGPLPLVLFSPRSDTLWSPLALTLIGGLAASALLTVLILPLLLQETKKIHSVAT